MDNEQTQVKEAYQKLQEVTLTEQQAAHVLGIERETLAGIRRKNDISYRKVTRQRIIYHIDDIIEYLNYRKVKANFLN